MKLYNIKNRNERVTFSQAILQGIGTNQGLFFPVNLPKFSEFEIKNLLEMSFVERSAYVLSAYIGDEILQENVLRCVSSAFNFPVPLRFLNDNIAVLELFHGPTLAFKDFGSRLMAQMLCQVKQNYNKPMVILTATSGDTGAAVAHAFYKLDNVYVIILYPKDKISILQEKLFCTLGNNIFTISVDGNFDMCQDLIKQAFLDNELRTVLDLNSANSINISRILGQVCYYFEAVSQLPCRMRNNLVISVPSGNFGNLTAGLFAQSLGLLIKKFVVATNLNDTVPRFLQHGYWQPFPTVSTFSNAMDVSCPNNWPRIEELFVREKRSIKELGYGCVNDLFTEIAVKELADLGYLSEPHAAVAYRVLCDQLLSDEFGVFLGTAHPAKFTELVECFLGENLKVLLPTSLKERMNLPILSYTISHCFSTLRNLILKLVF